jgi:hypothetical protein
LLDIVYPTQTWVVVIASLAVIKCASARSVYGSVLPDDLGWQLLSAWRVCPEADHGMSGIAENGDAIVCENDNGWRWVAA